MRSMMKPPTPPQENRPRPKIAVPNRRQIEMQVVDLERLIPDDHPVRIVWAYVEGLDLSPLYANIKSVEGGPSGHVTDPRVLMALWLFATVEGVGSARELDRLCKRDNLYRWILGGLTTNYHTLSDFRVGHRELLDSLLTQGVAGLMHEGLVDLNRVAQDGMRVRASAGAASFRREPTLEQCVRDAEEQVANLKKEIDTDPKGASDQVHAARERAATDRLARVRKALETAKKIKETKQDADTDKVRASTTDPDARVMKMADGGFRPAFNVQFGTEVGAQIIVGVDVIHTGSDQGQAVPLVRQMQERYEQVPEQYLVDGGFASHDDIDTLESAGIEVYAPVQKPKGSSRDPYAPRASDWPGVARWRKRMGTEQAKEIYKDRAATAECVNAIARNRGLRQFLVRGLEKVRAVALWYALAHNLMRAWHLRQACPQPG
jgi:transposase